MAQEEENPKKTCLLKDKCLLCSLGAPASITVKNPTWPAIMRVVLYTLAENNLGKKYFGLKHDIYPFIDAHWDVLCTGKTTKWHKPMQDALSHGLNLFVSGRGHHGTGFWGLKVHSDPWSSMEVGESEETASPLVFPLSQKVEVKGKRKRSEDLSETRKMRAQLLGNVKSLNQDLMKMEEQLRDIKTDFEQYKVESVASVKHFNATKDQAEKEVMQYRQMCQGGSVRSTSQHESPLNLHM